MLATEPLARARPILGDTIEPYRWPDTTLLLYLDDAQGEIIRRRSDAGLSLTGVVLAPPKLAAVGSTMTVGGAFLQACADYVLWRAFSQDAEHAANAVRATSHLQAFAAEIG